MFLDDKKTTEYQIFIGCNDAHNGKVLVTEKELRDVVTAFFNKKRIDFSMVSPAIVTMK